MDRAYVVNTGDEKEHITRIFPAVLLLQEHGPWRNMGRTGLWKERRI